MIRYATTIQIERPPGEVLAVLTDPSRFHEWTEMVDVRFDTAEPRVGTRGTFRLAKGPIKGTISVEIVEFVPDRKVVFRITHPTLSWRAVSELTPTASGTELLYAGELSLRGWRRILEPLMAGEVRAGERAEAERLKVVLEHGPATLTRADERTTLSA